MSGRLNPLRDKNQGDYDLASIYSGGGGGRQGDRVTKGGTENGGLGPAEPLLLIPPITTWPLLQSPILIVCFDL